MLIAALLVYHLCFAAPKELDRDRIVMRDGLAFDGKARMPFSGIIVERYAEGGRHTAIEMRRGKVHGWSRGWFQNGKLEVEESFADGVSHGVRRRWFDNGQRRSETHIEKGQLRGLYVEWYDNGQKAAEMTLAGGKPDGEAKAWYRSGALKSQTHLKLGNILEQQFFPEFVSQTATAPAQP